MSDGRLCRLNDAERAVLRLLAEGHTAKSAATALDSSEPAVNERLREARRKTGFGSSRELARAVVAQENRDREIGDAGSGEAAQVEAAPRRLRGVVTIGVLTMSLLLTAVALFVLQPDQAPPTPSGRADPLVAGLMQRDNPSPPQLYRRLREERRDDDWAGRSETALATRYRAIAGGGEGQQIRVLCGARLCEIAGSLPESAGVGDRVAALQSATLSADLRAEGFTVVLFTLAANTLQSPSQGASVVTVGERPGEIVFVTYLERVGPA